MMVETHGIIRQVTSRKELEELLEQGKAARLNSLFLEVMPIEFVADRFANQFIVMINPARVITMGDRQVIKQHVLGMLDEYFDAMEADGPES